MSRSDHPGPPESHVSELLHQITEQKALVQRMIVQGAATQAAEDRLCELQQSLLHMRDRRQYMRASDVQRKVLDRRR